MDLLTFIMCWIVFAVIAGWRFYIWKNESKAGITLEDRNDTFGAKFFGVRMRTIDFVLLNFITGNFLFAYFCYDMSKRLKKRYPQAGIMVVLVIIGIALMMWNANLLMAQYDRVFSSLKETGIAQLPVTLGWAGTVFAVISLVELVILIALSLMSKGYIERFMMEEGVGCSMSWIFCLIMPIFYQYYCIRNAERRCGKEVPGGQQENPLDSASSSDTAETK